MSDERHNGHRNYETWSYSLWLSNDYHTQRFWESTAEEAIRDNDGDIEMAVSDLREMLRENAEAELDSVIDPANASWVTDIANAAFREIDFHEVATSLIEDAVRGMDKCELDALREGEEVEG